MAGRLYDSLHGKLLVLADEVEVYPAHGAGSACGKNISSERWSTIGAQRATNPALQPMTRDEFVVLATTGLCAPPQYFPHDAELNRRGPRALDELAPVPELEPADVRARQAAGAVVLDTRRNVAYGAGHVPGALNVGLGGQFASWAGTLIAADDDVVLVCEGDELAEARTRLARVGLERVVGTLAGGFAAWEAAGLPTARFEQIGVDELAARLAAADPPQVVDVRGPGEYEGGHVPGAVSAPLPTLAAELEERLAAFDRARPDRGRVRGRVPIERGAPRARRRGLHDARERARRDERLGRGGTPGRAARGGLREGAPRRYTLRLHEHPRHRQGLSGRRAAAELSGDGGAHPRALGARGDLPRVRRAATGGGERRQRIRLLRRPALRQRAPALRAPPDRLREGRGAALPHDAWQAGRAALRLGLPRAAGRDGDGEGARRLGAAGDPRVRHRPLQRELPDLRPQVHGRVGALRLAAGALGRLRTRLQDHGPLLHGERAVGLQVALGQGARLRGLPGHALFVGGRDAGLELRDPSRQLLPPAPGPGDHGALPARAARGRPGPALHPGLDDDPVDASLQPRARGRTRHRLRGVRGGRRALRGRGCRRVQVRARARRRDAGGRAEGSGARRPDVHPALPVLRGSRGRLPRAPWRLRRHRGRHRRRAHGAGLRRGRPGAVRRARDRGRVPRRRAGPLHERGSRLGGRARLRREQADHPGAQGAGRARQARDLRAQLPALLAHRRAAHLPRALLVVREGQRVQGPDGRAQPGDPLGPRARQGRPVRQVARERARLVDQPQPLLGSADPCVAQRRPGVPARRRVREPRRARAGLRRAAGRPPPAVHRRAHPPEPRRPDGQEHDAARAGRAGLLVRVGLDVVRPGALPVRAQGVVREPLPGGLHHRVHRPDARLVLHDDRPRDGAVRPATVPARDLSRRRARRERAEAVEADCATTRVRRRCSRPTARMRSGGS